MNLPTVIVTIAVASATTTMAMSYLGDIQGTASRDAEATRLVNEGQQVANAVTVMMLDKGAAPSPLQSNPVDELRTQGYLNGVPEGGVVGGAPTGWRIDYEKRAVMSPIGTSADPKARELCLAARRRLNLDNPTMIYNCSGADAPGGILGDREPCCINTGA